MTHMPVQPNLSIMRFCHDKKPSTPIENTDYFDIKQFVLCFFHLALLLLMTLPKVWGMSV